MHICIVGTGAAGWIACNYLKEFDFVEKVTIIGSSKIPPIGVGESNTVLLTSLLNFLAEQNNFSIEEFIKESDAALKYGVMYENWSKNKFLHYFKTAEEFEEDQGNFGINGYGRSLANKEKDVPLHDIMGKTLFDAVNNNEVLLNQTAYDYSYHFDAAAFINFFKKIAMKNKKVAFFDDKVLGGEKQGDKVEKIYTEKNGNLSADFFIFATGDYEINEKFLEINYKDFSHILLTNKAVVYPLQYRDKRKEFHPYTIARAMDCGWRWITPTWSRVGTGYVFSSNHISEDQAIEELKSSAGNKNIEPFVVDFNPRHNERELHENWSTIGMASGFLEPLDAPGLSMTINALMNQIAPYLFYIKNNPNSSLEKNKFEIEKINDISNSRFDFWCSFILAQYKTSNKNHTKFWIDQKNIIWEKYNDIMKNLDEYNPSIEKMMLYQTLAGKDIQWESSIKSAPLKTKDVSYFSVNHLDFIQGVRSL
jgi:hypothetical protein